MGTSSKDETLRVKSGCDTTRKPCHQLLVAGIVPKLRDGKVQADCDSQAGPGSPALHHSANGAGLQEGIHCGIELTHFSKQHTHSKQMDHKDRPLHSSSSPIRAKATPTIGGEAAWYREVSSNPEAKTPVL